MKKIVRQQNYLRELIDSQANLLLTRQALKCWIRSAVEPLLDAPESGVVLYRIEDRDGLTGLLKRLEFSEVESHSFSDDSGNLIEKVWANTEFLCVMTHRYVSILLWDNLSGDKDHVRYYSLYNSKLQYEPLDVIKRNSKIDIAQYQEKFNPDRRDNILLNASIRRLIGNMDEARNDAVLGYAEQSVGNLVDSDFIKKKSQIVAHEIKNQLSICDLYSEIIKKHSESGNVEAIQSAVKSINKALKMANNSLLSLKTKDETNLQPISLKDVVENAVELSKVYLDSKQIELQVENNDQSIILADNEKLTAVIINIVKNATEAFVIEDENAPQNGKYIKIKTEVSESTANIYISNNAIGITNPDKIFNEGYSTKTTGSGLGLWICKKSIEEQMGELELCRSTEDYTEFVIKLGLGG